MGNGTVRLKNGSEEAVGLVRAVMISMRSLEMIPLYELTMLARDRNHELFTPALGEKLAGLSLITERGESWDMHDCVRNIVMSAMEGELLEMRMVDPRAVE
jgi:hypothetical protein